MFLEYLTHDLSKDAWKVSGKWTINVSKSETAQKPRRAPVAARRNK